MTAPREADEPVVLYLHGRGSRSDAPPGDLVAAAPWSAPLVAPALTDDWLSQPFSELVAQVDGWLETAALGVGHSFGAWLLLCAAVERVERGAAVPSLCLLAPILGKGFQRASGVGYFSPRAKPVRAALGLGSGRADARLRSCLRFVHGEQDEQSSIEDAYALRSLGYVVSVVPGGHRLDAPEARTGAAAILRDFAGQ